MAISTNYNRIVAAKNAIISDSNSIISSLQGKGVTVPEGTVLAGVAAIVDDLPVLDTSDATAVAGDMLNGKTAYVNGSKVTGNIASQSAQTITPSTSNQTIASGQYLSGTQTIAGDADLVATNIKSGASIFGVDGSVNEWKVASGTANASGGQLVISGLSFTPHMLVGQVGGANFLAYSDILQEAGAAKDFLQMLTSDPWYATTASAVAEYGSITLNLRTGSGAAWSPTNIHYVVAGY